MPRHILASVFIVILLPLSFAQAGEPTIPAAPTTSPFDSGQLEFQPMAGALYSFGRDPARTTIDYAAASLRLGMMLGKIQGGGLLRGNFEVLGEAFGGGIFRGPGNVLAGGALLLRYNFIQPKTRLVPYFQLGGGGLYIDSYKNPSQVVIGEAFEFNVQGALGMRYMLNEKWAIGIEGDYRHISNANLAPRNLGLNSVGGFAGVSYFF